MRIFLTGATGYIGSAALDAILRAGHQATALVRDPEHADLVAARGVLPVIGDLSNPRSYVAQAETCEGVIHTGFDRSKRAPAVDRAAIDGLVEAMRRRAASDSVRKPFFVYTSALWVIGNALCPLHEDAALDPTPFVAWRAEHERLTLAADADGVRTAVIRPGIVYGGHRGIIADLVRDATNGLVRVIGTGKQHWPCIYDRDLADLYVKVAVLGDASGVYHANDEADERVGDIVDAIATHVDTRPDIRYMPMPEARAKLGDYADALALDQKVRGPRARALGWAPTLHSVAGSVARLLEEFRTASREAA